MLFNKDLRLKQLEKAVLDLPSYVYFADEQDTQESMLFGGYLVHRQKLAELDEGMIAIKEAVGLTARDPIKWSPGQKGYEAQRGLTHEQRKSLREEVPKLLLQLDATAFFSLVWKYDKGYTVGAYKYAFENVLQRLIITIERKAKAKKAIWYPGLDVVVDWFPQPSRRREFLGIYDHAYYNGYDFQKNKLPPLKELNACPCLLVTSCQFSPGLQLADFAVGAIGQLFRWAYQRDSSPEDVLTTTKSVIESLLRIDGKILGFGLVLPTGGAARTKMEEALSTLGY